MLRTFPLAIVILLGLGLGIMVSCSSSGSKGGGISRGLTLRERLAKSLLADSRVQFANYHVSGRRDNATALDNIRQTAVGLPAARSSYGRAPGGYTRLSTPMLKAMKTMSRRGYQFHVTSIAGSSHSSKSRHYLGVAFDVNRINGRKIGHNSPYWRDFIRQCKAMGATETLGPGDRGHSSHIHVAWPRTDRR